MPIEIFTGLPGNGKTAFMMERLHQEAEKGERPLFAAGINGLDPGLATVLEDPRKWNEVKEGEEGTCNCTAGEPGHAHVVPDGSLIFVDEAWKWFGHLHDASRQATPPHVLQLAEHRHRGLDFVWTSQGPNQIYPFARTLIASHTHMVRRFGTQLVEQFKWSELQDDVKSPARREQAMRATKALPKHVFGTYKSAEIHTIKPKIPFRVFAIPLMLIVAVLFGWLAYQKIKPAQPEDMPGAEANASSLASPQDWQTPPGQPDARKPLTPTEYAELHLPRFATMPWTAQLFDERPAVSDPQLYCMASGAGLNGSGEWTEGGCHCVTEQGTRYDLGEGECRRVARLGTPYNPYRERRDNRNDAPREQFAHVANGPRYQPLPAFAGGSAGTAPRPTVSADFGTITRPVN